jgi:hypothetical protein
VLVALLLSEVVVTEEEEEGPAPSDIRTEERVVSGAVLMAPGFRDTPAARDYRYL